MNIPSSADGTVQPAYFFRSPHEEPRPLIISLHTWSGGFDQRDTLSWLCVEQGYHYIHPHFRGPNNRYEACGSALVIQDIEDAIDYALKNALVDTSEIHVIGASGGGYATLLTYLKTDHPVKTFSAWVPISDLESWYYESEGRDSKYAWDIARATTEHAFSRDEYFPDLEEARRRSPLYMPVPVDKRRHTKLYLYAGIHDGYTGSVPITHSLNFYNKVVHAFDKKEEEALVPLADIHSLVVRRNFAVKAPAFLGDRRIHYQRQFQDKVRITIFEGGHEMLPGAALDQVGAKRLLAIGDSNGAAEEGWVNQLRNIRFDDFIYNTSISGNTIGFDNLGNPRLNTLRQVDLYLDEASDTLGRIDAVLVMLGTNDCKAVYQDSLALVTDNLRYLLRRIRAHSPHGSDIPIFLISPPPYGPDHMAIEKYRGASARMARLQPAFREIARKQDCLFIDIYSKLLPIIGHLTTDGVHLHPAGQQLVAEMISKKIDR